MKHPSGKEIKIHPKTYRFYVKGEKYKFTSVSKLLNKFFPEFQREKVAKKYAEKHNLNWKDVVKEWDKAGKEAAKRGNKYHKFAEKVYKNFISGNYEGRVSGFGKDKIERRMEKILLNLYHTYSPLPTEYIVGSLPLEIAGIADQIFLSSYFIKENNTLVIIDWKFVKEIKRTNMWESALYPIQHMDNCNYYKYALQLNLLSFIIRKENYFPEYPNHKMYLFHVGEEDIDSIEIPDMQQDVRNMIMEWYNGKEKN